MHDDCLHHYCPPSEISERSYCVDKYSAAAFLEIAIDLHASISNVLHKSGGHSFYEAIPMKFSVPFKFQQLERGGMLCI